LQRLQNKILLTIGNLLRRTSTRDLQTAFQIPYYKILLQNYAGSKQTVILNHENVNIRTIGQGEARHRKYERLKIGGQAYD
jgi:hypothetical protein